MSYSTPEDFASIQQSRPVCKNCGRSDCRGTSRRVVLSLLMGWALVALFHLFVAFYAQDARFAIMPLLTLGCLGGVSGI